MKAYYMDDNEKVIWEGRPSKLMYVFNGFNLFVTIFFIIWAGIFLTASGFFSQFSRELSTAAPDGFFPKSFGVFEFIPYIIMFVILMIFVVGPIRKIIESFRVKYYITDLRVYIESGIIGTDIKSLEYKEIDKLNVNVGLLGKMLNRGTVSLTPDRVYSDGDDSYTRSGFKLIGIKDHYEVYKLIKRNALDVTTDQQYPNAYRPDKNTGYNTKLDND